IPLGVASLSHHIGDDARARILNPEEDGPHQVRRQFILSIDHNDHVSYAIQFDVLHLIAEAIATPGPSSIEVERSLPLHLYSELAVFITCSQDRLSSTHGKVRGQARGGDEHSGE